MTSTNGTNNASAVLKVKDRQLNRVGNCEMFAGAPLDLVAIDILSGLPVTSDGLKYVLVVTDYFSKWTLCQILTHLHACGFFTTIRWSFWTPQTTTQRSRQKIRIKTLCWVVQVSRYRQDWKNTISPATWGQTKRMNRTILQMLRTSAHDNPVNWPLKLPWILAVYRMTVHKPTVITPNMAMLGREVPLTTTLIACSPDEPMNVTVPFVHDFRHTLRAAHDREFDKPSSLQLKFKRHCIDRQVKWPPFAVDQRVWSGCIGQDHPLPQQHIKLQRLWVGPWRILSFKKSSSCGYTARKVTQATNGAQWPASTMFDAGYTDYKNFKHNSIPYEWWYCPNWSAKWPTANAVPNSN